MAVRAVAANVIAIMAAGMKRDMRYLLGETLTFL
jgi:hypothetical protein